MQYGGLLQSSLGVHTHGGHGSFAKALILPRPCGAPSQDEGVYPWALGREADGFEVGEGFELEVGVGEYAEADASSEVDAGTGMPYGHGSINSCGIKTNM